MTPATDFCVPLPEPKNIKIPLPFGVEISSILDASRPPSDCAIVHSLMLQLTPMLAGLTCMLRVLAVIKALKDAVSTVPPDFAGLIEKIEELISCFLLLDPCELSKMISGILCMIIAYLNCLIQAFESILNFQVGIDLDSAEGNPVLLANLTCAQNNAQAALEGLNTSMEGVKPLLDMVGMLMEIVGLPPLELPPLTTPSAADLLAGEDPLAPIKTMRTALTVANNALPCKVC
jgi:hypothetical protein